MGYNSKSEVFYLATIILFVIGAILRHLTPESFYSNEDNDEVSITYNNHSYIRIKQCSTWIHDPDCETCLERLNSIIDKRLDKRLLEHLSPVSPADQIGIMLTQDNGSDCLVSPTYGHGVPAPRQPNDPPGVTREYPVYVIENDKYYNFEKLITNATN